MNKTIASNKSQVIRNVDGLVSARNINIFKLLIVGVPLLYSILHRIPTRELFGDASDIGLVGYLKRLSLSPYVWGVFWGISLFLTFFWTKSHRVVMIHLCMFLPVGLIYYTAFAFVYFYVSGFCLGFFTWVATVLIMVKACRAGKSIPKTK